jgi:hypothetical protein
MNFMTQAKKKKLAKKAKKYCIEITCLKIVMM